MNTLVFPPKGVIWWILLISSVDSEVCRLCSYNGNRTDCSKQNLTAVPQCFPNSTTWIDLSHNQISAIGPQTFSGLTHLVYLNLSWNNINSLNGSAFIGLSELRYLNMNDNPLSYTSGLTDGVFSPLANLRELHLFTDDCPQLPPDRYLQDLRRLETLAIVVTQGGGFGSTLGDLQHLDTLLLTARLCNAQQLNENDLQSISGLPLRCLSLRNLKLDSLNPNFLKFFNRTLVKLDVSCNNLINLPSLIEALRGSAVETLLLDDAVTSLIPVEMNSAFFSAIQSIPLKILSVSQNLYLQVDIDEDLWSYWMPHLRYLRVGYSQFILRSTLSKGELFTAFAMVLYNANVLDISGLFNAVDGNDKINFCKELDPLFVLDRQAWENDQLQYPPPPWPPLWFLEAAYRFKANQKIMLPPVLTRFYAADLGGLLHNFLCQNTTIYFKNNVLILDFRHTSINVIDCDQSGFHSVADVSLGKVGLKRFDPAFFSVNSMPALNTLDLHDNELGPFIASPPVNGVFAGMNSVQLLDLSANKITSMHESILIGLHNVTLINLSLNSITMWDASVTSLTQLKTLDISSNGITALSMKAMAEFDAHAAVVPGFVVNMSSNPIRCLCSSIDFLRWLVNTGISHGVTTCIDGDTARLLDERLLGELQWQCRDRQLLIIALGALAAALLVTAMLLHCCKWRIKYAYYIVKRHCRQKPSSWLTDDVALYVSYHEKDIDKAEKLCEFLKNQLDACRIETRHTLTIGFYEFELIAALIDECHASIILITPESLSDSKSEFEFYMALQKGVHYILPIVTTDSFAMNGLPRALQKLLMSNNYLRLPAILNETLDSNQKTASEQGWRRFFITFESCLSNIIERQAYRRLRRSPDANSEQSDVIRSADCREREPLLENNYS